MMPQLEFDRFEAWFRSTCTCLEDDEINELLKTDLQESIDTEQFVFSNSETQHDWEVWQAASDEQLRCELRAAEAELAVLREFAAQRAEWARQDMEFHQRKVKEAYGE